MDAQTKTQAKFSIPSFIAIIAAVASFPAGAFWGFVLGLVAVFFGAIGVLLAFSSSVRGGILSTFAILAGMFGLIAAIVKGVAWLL